MISAKPKRPIATPTTPMPSDSSGDAEREALRPGVDVGADDAEQEARDDHRDGLDQRAAREHDRADEAQHHQEILGRAELRAAPTAGTATPATSMVATVPAKNEPSAAMAKRGAGLALARHLVAVEARHHGRRFARHVEQHGGGRSAVLRAVVDAGQHDERGRVGCSAYVVGSSIAMVATGPMPGSTPMSVPSMHPKNAYMRLTGVKATPKPVAR